MTLKRYSKKSIYQLADIDTGSIGVTYFPYPEATEKIGYSCGIYGCTAVLRRGYDSNALYAADPYANSDGYSPYDFRKSLGNREHDIIERLDHIEQVEPGKDGRAVIAFVAKDGARFTVATFDHGHTWEICG